MVKTHTKNVVHNSLSDIEATLSKNVGAHQLRVHEHMSDEEFRTVSRKLTEDIQTGFDEAKKRAFEEGFAAGVKSHQSTIRDGLLTAMASGELPRSNVSARSPPVAPHNAESCESVRDDLKRVFKTLSEQIETLSNDLQKPASPSDALESVSFELDQIKKRTLIQQEAFENLLSEQRDLTVQQNAKLETVSRMQESLDAKLYALTSTEQQLQTLSSQLQSQSDSLSQLQLHREEVERALEGAANRLDELQQRSPSAGGEDLGGLLDMVSDNTTRVNTLKRQLTRFSKKISRHGAHITRVYKLSARRKQTRNAIRSVRRLAEKKATKKKAGRKTQPKTVSKTIRTVRTIKRSARKKTVKPLAPAKAIPSKNKMVVEKTTVTKTTAGTP
ncbi:hypothetical protein KJ765_05360 [Candidatus Micrarchaeota archaeon]|nr:hypothetical protein [Candidatus Micrarchaeota archaeon]